MHINKIENRITFKIKTGHYLELLTPETMKLLGCTKRKITKNKNGEDIPNSETTEVVLVHCKIASKNYQQNSRVLHTFIPNKSFRQLLDISPNKFIFLKDTYHYYLLLLLIITLRLTYGERKICSTIKVSRYYVHGCRNIGKYFGKSISKKLSSKYS